MAMERQSCTRTCGRVLPLTLAEIHTRRGRSDGREPWCVPGARTLIACPPLDAGHSPRLAKAASRLFSLHFLKAACTLNGDSVVVALSTADDTGKARLPIDPHMTTFALLIVFAALAWAAWKAFAAKPTSLTRRPSSEEQSSAEFGTRPVPPAPPREDPQARHVKSALQFAKAQHSTLKVQRREQDAWQKAYGNENAIQLDQLSGPQFEKFLAGLYRAQGYQADLTSATGDYGGDLILRKDGQCICVQAKRYAGSVGVSAVQEALSGKSYYQCDAAWVITTGVFTTNALELARKSGVKMIGRSEIGNLMAKYAVTINNP